MENGSVVLLVIKLVDDVLIGGDDSRRAHLIEKMKRSFEVGTVSHTPGSLMYFGVTITQTDDGDIEMDANEKLNSVATKTITRNRRKEQSSPLTSIELRDYRSVNGSICFMGMIASPLASFVSSYLQQASHSAKVKHMLLQTRMLKDLKNFGARYSSRDQNTKASWESKSCHLEMRHDRTIEGSLDA